MKKKILLLLLCGILMSTTSAWHMAAQGNTEKGVALLIEAVNDNSVIEGAEMITLGQDINLTPENSNPNKFYWYKMNVKGGSFYEFDFSNAEFVSTLWAHAGDRLQLLKADGKTSLGSYYRGKQLIAPESDMLLYVLVERRYAEPTTTLTWRVNQLNQADNRLCEFPQAVIVNTDIETKHNTTKYNTLWYKTTLQGGKAYEVSHLNGNHDLYYYKGNPCGTSLNNSDENRISKNARTLMYVPETSVYYFWSYTQDLDAYHSDFNWRIEEVEGDNRLCQFATPVVLGEEFTINHQGTKTRWYKLDVNEGFMYLVDYSSIGHLSYQVYVYEACDANKHIEEGMFVKEFAFTAKSTGTYYIKCVNTNPWGEVPCTISTLADNRSCHYPLEVAPEEIVSGTNIPKTGLWYKLNLEADTIYEFDFTNISYAIKGKIYSDCEQTSPLAQGYIEKMLFKPTATSSYLLHLESTGYSTTVDWSWSYKLLPEGDNRLCECAIEATTDTTKVNVADGNNRFWFTYQVEAGKYYMIGSNDGLQIEVYTACGQDNPLIAIENSLLYKAESTATLYIKVTGYNVGEGEKSWFAYETTPDGRFCEHPLNATLGGIITTNNKQGDGNGMVWYHFMPEESGVYTIIAPDVEDFYANIDESQGVDPPYYAIFVLEDCPTDSEEPDFFSSLMPFMIAQCGHFGMSIEEFSRLSFEAQANKDYKIVVWLMSYGQVPLSSLNWTLTKTKDLTGTIDVSLVDSEGTIINAQDANVMLYQKIDGAILSADTLTYNQGRFISKELGYGTYLLYAENIGQGFDFKTYLSGWYANAGIWEDATEIELKEATKFIEFRPTAKPEDIFTGDITISGVVYEQDGSQKTSMEGVDVSIYRKKAQGQGALVQVANSPRRVVNQTQWEMIARLKTDATGKYRIDKLLADSYMIMVDLPGYTAENSGIVINASDGKSYENNNFEADKETMTIKKVVTSVGNANTSRFKLYPNPFDQEIVIENVKDSRLEIFNASGVCVYMQNLLQEREIVQVNQLPAGIYYLRITKDGKADSFVAVKKK